MSIDVKTRVCPRFFVQVGHETMYASSGNRHFFTKSCHCQTYGKKNDLQSTSYVHIMYQEGLIVDPRY